LGWLPALSCTAALGLLWVAVANRLAAGAAAAQLLFWLGTLTLVVPIFARLLVHRVARQERLALVLVLGLGLYLVKVMQSPFGFTYSDELIHLHNANQMLATGRLFTENPILPATALYPGLEGVTVAIVRLAGLDLFHAGLVVVGLARVVMMLALFLLFEALSGSAHAAGLASTLYAANTNFLFWSAQWSYESLALPLAVLTLFIVARREAGREAEERLGLTVAALLFIGAVAVTHHLSSYFLGAALLGWTVLACLPAYLRHGPNRPAQRAQAPGATTDGPGGLALFALAVALVWMIYVANLTLRYLSPVFGKALVSVAGMIAGEAGGRPLFQAASGEFAAPVWERVVGIAAVLLCLLGLPFGLRQVARRHRRHPFVIWLTLAAMAYFAVLGLRLVPPAWEISNRSSEFLFLGLGLVLAVGRARTGRRARRLLPPLLTAAIAVIFVGGLIAGWPPRLRTAQVYEVAANDRRLQPTGLAAAGWARRVLGPGHTFAAHEAAGRLLVAYGEQHALVGRQEGVKSIFEESNLQAWQIELLRAAHVAYLAVDRRLAGGDNMTGYFFDLGRDGAPAAELLPFEVYAKFDLLPEVSRIFDSGDLVLYDIRAWIDDAARP
jgi:hypothetical protein